jgi:AcrR family transcriptional regulator
MDSTMAYPKKPAVLPRKPGKVRRPRRPRSATPLTRARIVATALALVDREGLQGLSMRRLGAELGVDPMAVYHHLPNKDALLDALVEAVMGEIDLSRDDPAESPEERVLCAARAYREVMLAHANALPIVLARGPATPVALRPVELLVGVLRAAGLPPEQALAGMNAIAAAVRGEVGMAAHHAGRGTPARTAEARAADFPAAQFPFLHEAILCAGEASERDFEFGIRALARGLIAAGGNPESVRNGQA